MNGHKRRAERPTTAAKKGQKAALGIRARAVGRPIMAAKKGQKATLGIRASVDLKARLNQAAKANSRSLSQEAELRLEQSFRDEQTMEAVAPLIFGSQLAGVMALIGDAGKNTCQRASYVSTMSAAAEIDWLNDAFTFDQFAQAVSCILDALRPPGRTGVLKQTGRPPATNEWWIRYIGKMMAGLLLDGVRDPERADLPVQVRDATFPWLIERNRRVRELLGPAVANRVAFNWDEIETAAQGVEQ